MVEIGGAQFSEPEFWDRLVQHDPALALHQSRALTSTSESAVVRALAWGGAARSLFELGRLDEANAAARAALAWSESDVPDHVRGSIGLSAAVIIAESGHIDDGLEALRRLGSECDGVRLGRVKLQTAYVLHHAGRLNDALVQLDLSEQLIVAHGEDRDRFRVHQYRGLVLLQQGRLAPAEEDFIAAESIARNLGLTASEAQSIANRAVLYGRSRRLTDSLDQFKRAEALYAQAGNPARIVAMMEIDRAEVMMLFGLSLDAITAAQRAIELVEPSGNRMLLGDAQVILARAELASGRLRNAIRSAEFASRTLATSGRSEMVAHARSIAAQARLRVVDNGDDGRRCLAEADDVAAILRADGWHQLADELVVARVRAAVAVDLYDEIASDLEHLRLGAWSEQRDLALAGWFAEALVRRHSGAPLGAIEACARGLDQLDDIVAEASSLEQRSAAMRLGNDLSRLAIALAVELGDADTVLAAAEGTRARALHEGLAAPRRHDPLTHAGADELRRELAGRLGDRTLVEWVVVGDTVWAVVFDSSGSRLVEIGDRRAVARARDRVLVWLDLAASEPDDSSVRALRAALLLDELLMRPLDLRPDSGVVIVPVDLLHGVPWSGLPSFEGRPVSLTPNAQLWLEADRRSSGAIGSVAAVIGPDIVSANLERFAVMANHADAALAGGHGATAATVRSMFHGYDLVHVAAHGTFRSDHPLMSTLRLADGEATLYEAVPDRVRSRLVILSSCEGGAHGTSDGSEVLGLAAVLLARGAASVLAPLTVVRDLECAEFVSEVHVELAAGEPVACAVAAVRQRWLADDDLSRWAVASSFTCFGSGAVVVGHS